MIRKHLSIYNLSKLTGIKYDVIKRYHNNQIEKYDSYILAKLCFTLNCSISDLLKYAV